MKKLQGKTKKNALSGKKSRKPMQENKLDEMKNNKKKRDARFEATRRHATANQRHSYGSHLTETISNVRKGRLRSKKPGKSAAGKKINTSRLGQCRSGKKTELEMRIKRSRGTNGQTGAKVQKGGTKQKKAATVTGYAGGNVGEKCKLQELWNHNTIVKGGERTSQGTGRQMRAPIVTLTKNQKTGNAGERGRLEGRANTVI